MLRAISKAAYRVWSPDTAAGTLIAAAREALTPPLGPVSVEIPIDVQKAPVRRPAALTPLAPIARVAASDDLARLADMLAQSRRPLLWLGGGARNAAAAVRRLMALGIGVVTSVNGRGAVDETDAMTLGAFNNAPAIESFYASADLCVIVGSRLRGAETRAFTLALPPRLAQIDADPRAWNRNYEVEHFVCADAAQALAALADALSGRMDVDPAFAGDLAQAKAEAMAAMRRTLGPYAEICDALRAAMPRDAVWARDITVSNSTWGNRLLAVHGPRDALLPVGGGIGQGVQLGMGACLAAPARKVVALSGDGGLAVNIGELATAVQESLDLVIVVMNDNGYGVIRNIQDAAYGGRHYFTELFLPDLQAHAHNLGIPSWRAGSVDEFTAAIGAAMATRGPALVEVDMEALGPFPVPFAGPPPGRAKASP